MITSTLIQGLSDQMVQARVNSFDASKFQFGTHFPVTKVVGFSWQTIYDQLERLNVAAEIHADNSSIVRKSRPTLDTAGGDIPHIAVSREMSRKDLKAYQTAAAVAKDADAIKLVQHWGKDVDFCFNAVQSELEFIAWAMASNAGSLAFTPANSATMATQFNLDYQVSDNLKAQTSSDWARSNADIIGDLVKAVKQAKAVGLNPRFAFVNLDEFYKIVTNERIVALSSSYLANAVGVAQTPDLATLNTMLARQAWLNGLQLRVIDQQITREFADGTSTTANPFANSRLILSETEKLGSTQYDILEENNPNVIRSQRAHTIVKKYSTIEPLAEITIGEADAMPVFDTAYRNIYLRTDGNSW